MIAQLTAPVKWTQSMQNMIADGASHFTEIGPGNVLQGLMRKIDRSVDDIKRRNLILITIKKETACKAVSFF